MKKLYALLLALGLVLGASTAIAAEGGIPWDKAPSKTNDQVALQNGAKLFVNYCLNCHSAAFMRYNRMTEIGLTEKQIKENLLFGSNKVGNTMMAAIDPNQAKEWFGGNPPDLTLMTRSRSDGSKEPPKVSAAAPPPNAPAQLDAMIHVRLLLSSGGLLFT